MEGVWLKTRVRKLIYETVNTRVEHPTLVEKASVKPYSKSDTNTQCQSYNMLYPLNSYPMSLTPGRQANKMISQNDLPQARWACLNQQCLLHLVKPNIINYYPKGEWKMTTKDRTKSFDSEINDYLILAQLLFFLKFNEHHNQIQEAS